MKTLFVALIALVSTVWAGGALIAGSPAGVSLPWMIRQESLYLTGYLSIALMSLAMLLAARPTWLEGPLGGMDRIYRSHKWAGIVAAGFASLHWLIEMSDDIVKALVGREGRPTKEKYAGILEALRDLGKDMGEWAIYAALAMVALALWKRFPYRSWRFVHRAMPVIYLMLAFHAVMLAPSYCWSQPAGWLLALLVGAGIYGSVDSLAGRIGRARRAKGEIVTVERSAPDVVGVTCRLDRNWRGHRAGQFAFITFDAGEGQHPFTIASADRGDRMVSFQIKALGDYTRGLADRLRPGQRVEVEGPYGRFDIARRNRKAHQIWIAGGIGVTPFLAWLESLRVDPTAAPAADLHYCTRDRESDPFVDRLTSLCAPLPDIRLHVHGFRQGEVLDAAGLVAGKDRSRFAEIWFCGPQGLAEGLKKGLQEAWSGGLAFRQEAFELR